MMAAQEMLRRVAPNLHCTVEVLRMNTPICWTLDRQPGQL